MLGAFLQAVRQAHPLIHCITNYVTVNDCANLLLAAGASPIMADAPEEAAEITARSQGLTLNLGTLQAGRVPAMLASGRQANRNGIPAVLDPVGAGASAFRTRTARQLLEEVRFAVIRGNLSEIQALAAGAGHPCGVDAGDRITPQTLDAALELARQLARRTGAVVAVTGGFCRRQPRPDPAGRRGRRLRHGPVRRDRLRPAGPPGGQRRLPGQDPGRGLPPDPRPAGGRSTL